MQLLLQPTDVLFYFGNGIAETAGIRMPGQESDDAFWNLSISQIVMQFDYPGTQMLKHRPICFLMLPLRAEQGATKHFMLIVHFLTLLVGQYRIH